ADRTLVEQTTEYLESLKDLFVESVSAFNQLRGLTVGGVKIYGISNSESDFMLFRNGYKLIFSMKKPGQIGIRFAFQGAGIIPGSPAAENTLTNATNEDLLEARWGAFGEIAWFYRDKPVKADFLVRYYTSRFIKESAK
ncbi:MAG: hypothetical protein KDD25_02220, partial [Bdellovibrionales bacterium]|nr:hypothetical protein [Bdellovibrionales bacterium]